VIEAVMLIIGFALLIKGADIFVGAGVGIAKKLMIPTVIIGLTIVALGTSAPEAVISITASIQGANSLAISNVIGSNIFNLMFIIGLCAMRKSIPFKAQEISKDFWVSIIAAVMLVGLKIIGGTHIPQWGSLILLAAFIAYIILLVRQALKTQGKEKIAEEDIGAQKSLPVMILLALLGCVMIVAGGQLTVDNATKIAISAGVTERIIGLTIVAMGTSLPELVTSLVACKKGENEFALGNIIGSNVFNIMFVLGVAGLINPLEFERALIYDTVFLIAGSLLALLFVYTSRRLARREGLVMVAMYAAYMAFVVAQ
jgi:cation:H+ antiporter